jgi:choline-sulfatase
MTRGSRPNIIILQADQMAAHALQLYGGFSATPNLAGIADAGTVFENAYCNYPLCAPSRFSMMTGQLPMAIGAFDNAAELPASLPTLAHYLRGAGYQTCLSGKMHFIGPDQLHGFEERVTTEIYPSDFAWLPDWSSGEQSFAPVRNSIETGGVCAWNMQLAFDEDVTFQATRKIYEYARHPDDPFCLVVSLTHPHHPFLVTPEYWEQFDHNEIPEPSVGRLPDSELDAHSERARRLLGVHETDVTSEQRRNARHAYFAAIRYVDDKIGTVLGALEATGASDSTAVFMVSDHGEMLGERGLWAKDCFFEWAMRIPFLMKLPGDGDRRRVSKNVSLVDLMPTILDLAGVDVNALSEPLAGNSLLADEADLSGRVLAEYSAEAAQSPMVMIRDGDYKFVHAETDSPMLFDLSTDPGELDNLATGEGHTAIVDDLSGQVAEIWDLEELDVAIRLSQRRRSVVGDALALGRHTSWDYEPERDYSDVYVRDASGGEIADRRVRVPAKGYRLPGVD